MAISEKEYLILSDLAYDNLLGTKEFLSRIYFDDNGKLRNSLVDKKNIDKTGVASLGVNRYGDNELKQGFEGVIESEDYKKVMREWKVIAVSNEENNSGYYGVAFEYDGEDRFEKRRNSSC